MPVIGVGKNVENLRKNVENKVKDDGVTELELQQALEKIPWIFGEEFMKVFQLE